MATAHPQISGLTDWSPLARGGFSTVWKARQITLDRLVAVKIDQRTLDDEKDQRRFLREAGAAGRLSGHPGIVTVHDAGILPDDRPYMVMELCPGGSLTQWLKDGNRRSQQKVRDIGVRIADALAAAHARGVLHRDVKPANILIDSYDNPGLADFGLASIPDAGMDLSVTMEALTPAYAPREVFYQQQPNEYGDVYSLSATLYALLCGRPPRWPEEGTPSVPEILELQREPVAPLPDVEPQLMAAVLAGLADEPDDRPTAAEFRDQLAAVQFDGGTGATTGGQSYLAATGAPVAVPATEEPADPPRASASPGRKRLRTIAVVAALVMLAVLATSAVAWFQRNPSAAPGPVATASASTSTEPTPSGAEPSASSANPTPAVTPTGAAAPDGFSACGGALGGQNFCVTAQECWNGYSSVTDAAANATPVSCTAEHVHQSFAGGQLPRYLQKQSEYPADAQVAALCSRATLRKVLANPGDLQANWTIEILPQQLYLDDNLFRCLVNTGSTRTTPLRFKQPG